MGLTIQANFVANRTLPNISLKHVKQDSIIYLGKYGVDQGTSLINYSPGSISAAVEAYQPQNIVYGDNYFSSSASNLSAGISATGFAKVIPATMFVAFNCGTIPGTGARFREIVSQWGDNPNTAGNPGRFSLGVFTDATGGNYITVVWGTSIDYQAFALGVDFSTQTQPILAIASRDAAGNVSIEVRTAGNTYKRSGQMTPVEIPAGSTAWRSLAGQISSRPLNGLKVYSSIQWNGAALTPDELTAEMDIIKVNLAGWV